MLMATARMSKIKPLKWLATAYIEFFRGTPLMVQLMFIFYGLPDDRRWSTFPKVSFIPDFDRFAAGVVAMSLNSLRVCCRNHSFGDSGGRRRADGSGAACLGFHHREAMTLVILPQAIRKILPALGNESVTIIKESSIVSVISIADLMFRAGRGSRCEKPIPALNALRDCRNHLLPADLPGRSADCSDGEGECPVAERDDCGSRFGI